MIKKNLTYCNNYSLYNDEKYVTENLLTWRLSLYVEDDCLFPPKL